MASIEPIEVEVAIKVAFEVVEEVAEHFNLEDPLQILRKNLSHSMENMISTKATTNSRKFWKNCEKVPWTPITEMEQLQRLPMSRFQKKVMMNLLKISLNPRPHLCLHLSMIRKNPSLTLFHLLQMKTLITSNSLEPEIIATRNSNSTKKHLGWPEIEEVVEATTIDEDTTVEVKAEDITAVKVVDNTAVREVLVEADATLAELDTTIKMVSEA